MPDYEELPPELEPVANHILFQFVDDIINNKHRTFSEKTNWGYDLGGSYQETTTQARWAYIIGLGPEVEDDLYVGQKILIEALRWTRAVDYNGLKFSRTESSNILAVEDSE